MRFEAAAVPSGALPLAGGVSVRRHARAGRGVGAGGIACGSDG